MAANIHTRTYFAIRILYTYIANDCNKSEKKNAVAIVTAHCAMQSSMTNLMDFVLPAVVSRKKRAKNQLPNTFSIHVISCTA